MSQCVPTCSSAPNLPISDYEVAELTWENGHLSMHGLGHHRIEKPIPKYPSPTWDKPRAGGTLESVVDQATRAQLLPPTTITSSSAVVAVDAIVPCSGGPQPDEQFGTCVGSCSGRKRARAGNCASQGSATSMDRAESTRVTLNDTCELNGVDEVEVGFTTTNSESPETENTSFRGRPLTFDDHDSVSHSRRSQQRGGTGGEEEKVKKGETVRSSISTKRSRAAAIHNQSERKRRDRINERIKTLQKLVPNSSKTDKASMLDEVIEYLKQLQAQIQMMSKMSNIPHMMTPMTMQQMQMSMMVQMTHMAQMAQMAQMGMGMGLMDLGSLARHGPAGMPHVLPPPPFPPSRRRFHLSSLPDTEAHEHGCVQ